MQFTERFALIRLVALLKDTFEGGGARCLEPEEIEEILSYLGIVRGTTGIKGEQFVMTVFGQELLDAYEELVEK